MPDLPCRKTWDEYAQVAQFITDQLAPNVYGAAHFRKAGSPGNQFSFLQQYRTNGGSFFDEADDEVAARFGGRAQDLPADDRRQ